MVNLKKTLLSLRQVECDWIYDPERSKNKGGKRTGPAEKVTLKPVMIGSMGKKVLWDHIGKGLFMCGTIINLDMFAEETGLDKSGKTYQLIRYETKWDKWNRTIHRVPDFEVTKANKSQKWSEQEWWGDYIAEMARILKKYEYERCLIHSVSHELAEELGRSLGAIFGKRILVSQSGKWKPGQKQLRGVVDGELLDEDLVGETLEKDEALRKYKATPFSVLISASLIRGTDLPDDLGRLLFLAKIPFPYLGDRRIKARLETTKTGQLYYMVQTVREVLQAFGRVIRHSQDWARIFVFDQHFDRIVKMKGLLPDYTIEATRGLGDYLSKHPPTPNPNA